MARDRPMIDAKHIDSEAALTHRTCHEILNGVLIAASGGKPHQVRKKDCLSREPVLDSASNPTLNRSIRHGSTEPYFQSP
jgi:hypothetical protein